MKRSIEKFTRNFQRMLSLKQQLQLLSLVQKLQEELLSTSGTLDEHLQDIERTNAVRESVSHDLEEFVLCIRDQGRN